MIVDYMPKFKFINLWFLWSFKLVFLGSKSKKKNLITIVMSVFTFVKSIKICFNFLNVFLLFFMDLRKLNIF